MVYRVMTRDGQEKEARQINTVCVILEENRRKETFISSDNWWSGDAVNKGIAQFT